MLSHNCTHFDFPTVINWGNSGLHTLQQSHNTLMVVKHSFLQNPALVTFVRWLTPRFWHAPKNWQISQLAMFDDTQGWWSNHPFSEFHDSHFSWSLKITIESPLKTLNRIESYLYKAPLNHQYHAIHSLRSIPHFLRISPNSTGPRRRHGVFPPCAPRATPWARTSVCRGRHTRPGQRRHPPWPSPGPGSSPVVQRWGINHGHIP